MTSACQTDNNGGNPWRYAGKGLCEHGKDGEEGKDEHGTHAACIGIHAPLLYEEFRQITTVDGHDGDDEIEHKDEHLTGHRCDRIAQRVEVVRSPEQEEPPHTVGHELADNERPRLTIFETVNQRQLVLLFLRLFCCDGFSSVGIV